ncbi:hypothetical protein [Priestia koreensis]|uniref:Uncharacterized protein n=1 Tax=Priestia koreensis TaxID=284581 RepID=A0A0M0L5X8_9BACI|nr:hypothetical protein [Priestia koreensis]KOO46466.1 hypothetical protein AMD01_11615 [Priestia koreensis]MCM3006347.1 hypothetical protein [Priestia koreensis]UNL83745.1 hypothetical protein IE339_16450 [Priestia koreensis]
MNRKRCHDNDKKKVVYCDPEYIVCDTYTEKEVIYVHPIKRINREHIRYVPRHVYEEETINEIIDPGEPDGCKDCHHKRRRGRW